MNSFYRRKVLKGAGTTLLSLGCGSQAHELLGEDQAKPLEEKRNIDKVKCRRIIFFLQNHGFAPLSCVPPGLTDNCLLDSFRLAQPMKTLEPYKSRMHIITNLHGRHTSPSHSAYYGALGGYRGGHGQAPSAATIDSVLSTLLPSSILPHLCISMETLEAMRNLPNLSGISATGARRPVLMHANPNMLYEMIFGSIASGETKANYMTQSKIWQETEIRVRRQGASLPHGERHRFEQYITGYREMNRLREKLSLIPDLLKKHAPLIDEKYLHPDNETDWHDRMLDIGISALTSKLTNVLTVVSGGPDVGGSWYGLGVRKEGHGLGHCIMHETEHWDIIREYNCRMLIKLIKALESFPEGKGTMMDHSLIVYTSHNGSTQHSDGKDWPVVMIGNGGGAYVTGQHTNAQGRPLNDFYTTLLRGVGVHQDHFNLNPTMVNLTESIAGPMEELLV